jgi:hypothetical protein
MREAVGVYRNHLFQGMPDKMRGLDTDFAITQSYSTTEHNLH